MKNLVSVPNPCHASWDKMTEQDNGRHCRSCDKVVVDFTNMSDEEIKNYFRAHQSQKICGHFKSDQVKRLKIVVKPRDLTNKGWDIYQISKVAIFLVFFSSLFSCTLKNDDGSNADIVIENVTENDDSINTTFLGDDNIEGKVAPMKLDTAQKQKETPKRVNSTIQNYHTEISGEPELISTTEDYNQETLTGIPLQDIE